jgi:hypothetical protein
MDNYALICGISANLGCIKMPKPMPGCFLPRCFKNLHETPPKDKSNLRLSVPVASDLDQEGQDSVDQCTIHVNSGGPKFGEWYQTFRLQTPKIRWSRYQSSIGISRGPIWWSLKKEIRVECTATFSRGAGVISPNSPVPAPVGDS